MEEGDRNCTTSHGISYHPTYQDRALSEEELKAHKPLPQKARKTLTLDNGGEFAAHEKWRREIDLPSFFCDPYASWQKGGIENTNGRLRRDMSRKTNINQLSKEDFDENILNYNTTPRKSLGWHTPLELFKMRQSHVLFLILVLQPLRFQQ
ncbi:MAG TPA: IS30 family transposase [Alphaproteobacteria bacterium]|nr:IS30 family transposase [Alphaproteobacteria bacterium]